MEVGALDRGWLDGRWFVEKVANPKRSGFRVGDEPRFRLYTSVSRTEGYTHAANVWGLSIVQGAVSVAPRLTLNVFDSQLFPSRCKAGPVRTGGGGGAVADAVDEQLRELRPRVRPVVVRHARDRHPHRRADLAVLVAQPLAMQCVS
jgi:hypothetical protein